jgi:hypothetical protein
MLSTIYELCAYPQFGYGLGGDIVDGNQHNQSASCSSVPQRVPEHHGTFDSISMRSLGQ